MVGRYDPFADRAFRRRTCGMSEAQVRAVHAFDDAERRREEAEAREAEQVLAAMRAERRRQDAEDYIEGDAGTRAAFADTFFKHGRGAR